MAESARLTTTSCPRRHPAPHLTRRTAADSVRRPIARLTFDPSLRVHPAQEQPTPPPDLARRTSQTGAIPLGGLAAAGEIPGAD